MAASIWNPGGNQLMPAANGTGTVTERFIMTAGQTGITLTLFTYTVGVNSLIVSVNGAVQTLGTGYTESTPSTIILQGSSVEGDEVTVIGILNLVNIVISGGTSTPLGGVALADFTINHSTVNGNTGVYATNPAGWNTGVGRMTVDLQVTPTGYFAANPNGHFAVVLRQDPALAGTAVRGQGIAIGNTTGFAQPSDLNPTPLLETWFNGIGAGNFLWSNSESARTYKMVDGTKYRIIIDSTKTNEGNRYLRYRMWSLQGTVWRAEVDTGDVLDAVNTGADLTQSGFLIGQVFESNLSTWSLPFTNVNITWGPAESATPDQTIKLSRFGAQLEGDLTLVGTGRTVKFPANAGPSLATSFSFQSAETNTGTVPVIKPNGTSTVANHLYTNSSSSTTTYQAVTFGMTGAVAQLETLGYAAANPVFGVNIGAGNRVATFKTTGLNILGGSRDIGQGLGYSINITNWGGTNAAAFSTTWTMDIDALSAVGAIAGTLGGSYSAATIENAIRPLYCMLSYLIKDLRDKKVI